MDTISSLTRVQLSNLPKAWQKDEKGKPSAYCQDNIRLALEKLGIRPTYDLLKRNILVNNDVLQDSHLNDLWLLVDKKFKFRPQRELFDAVVDREARANGFHPVQQYLDGLEWDGVPRLDTWLHTYFNADNTPYTQAVGAITLIAAVRRVRSPGCKFDELLILESPQGIGKSTGIRILAVKDDWYTDSLKLNVPPKVIIEETGGFWIVEIPELQGLRKSDWDQLKATLSRQADVARLSYDRIPTDKPRAFVAIGTTNGERYMSDPTGNRRFWPVRLAPTKIDHAAIRRDRDQLWAEAAAREADGAEIRLPESLWNTASEEQNARMREDVFFLRLQDALGDEDGRITLDTALEIVGIKPGAERSDVLPRLHTAMEKLHFKRGANKGRISVKSALLQGYTRGGVTSGKALPLFTFVDGKIIRKV